MTDKMNYKSAISWFREFENDVDDNYTDENNYSKRNLPWVERFRPHTLDDVLSTSDNISEFKTFIEKKQFPHMILYGPPGTGKTSTIKACARQLYGKNINTMLLIINASEERGIQIIRDKVKNFSMTKGIFLKKDAPVFKIVVLDEADSMTIDAQAILRSVIEKHTKNVRFCLICNYISKINPAIKSRCTPFRFAPLNLKNITLRINNINKILKLNIKPDGINMLYKISNGDMRKLLNNMQATSSIFPVINEENVSKFANYPSISNIKKIYKILNESSFKESFEQINKIIEDNHYNISDLIKELGEITTTKFINDEIPHSSFENIIRKLSDIETNIALSCNPKIQLQSIIGIFIMN